MKKRIPVLLLAIALLISVFSYPVLAAGSAGEVLEAALQLLYYNEGSYGSVNANDNGAVSVGKIQWHANRALNLLKTIVNADQEEALSILGEDLYSEILTATSWATRTVNATEKSAISTLLKTDQGKAAQDALATKDVTAYINRARNLGIADPAALVYFADLENQGGAGMSTRVARAAANTVGGYAQVTLLDLHNAALEDSVAGRYATRRNRTYNYCNNLTWADGCTVTFDATGGSCSIRSKTVTLGAQYGTLPIPTRDGYTFRGWSLTQNSSFVTFVHETTEVATSENHTLYAYWWANEYTVTFDAAGGTVDRNEMTVHFDRPYNYLNDGLPVPQRDGYLFVGWYTASGGGDKVTDSTVVSIPEHHTLYARWIVDDENCLCATEYAGCYVCATSQGTSLRIRGGHGTSYDSVGLIPSGAMVRVLKASGGTDDDWAHVEYQGTFGYTSMKYLRKIECDYSIDTITEPTCTEDGYTTHTCSGCGDSFADSFVEATGHSYDSGRVTTAAACDAEGTRTYSCTECGATKTEKLPATGHSWDNGTVSSEPTCTETGTRTYACGSCGSTRTEEIPAIGHDFTEGVVVIEPTATETGLMTYACRTCRYTESREIPALGLDHTDICPSKDFVDVPGEDNWAHAGIDYALENGLFSGTGANTFEPDINMSRAMLVTVLWRYEGKPESGTHSFTDVPDGQWYSQAVAWAASEGVVAGKGDGTFDPTGDVTREQMALILYRYAQRIGVDTSAKADLSGYPDASRVAGWSEEAVRWAVAEEIISGAVKDGQTVLAPQDSATRAVVASIMMRFIENVVN